MTRDDVHALMDDGLAELERAGALARVARQAHGNQPGDVPTNPRVARAFDDAADSYEVAIDAAIEVYDREASTAFLGAALEARSLMLTARLDAFRWRHEQIPGLGEYWSTPRYRISAAEAQRRLRRAGVKQRRNKYYYDGREIRLPGYLVPTPLGSGLFGLLGLMSDEDGGKPNLWYIQVSREDISEAQRRGLR